MPPISLSAPLATHNLLSSFHHHPALPKHTFYFIASVAFSILNRPEEIPRVWNYALNEVAIRGSSEEDYVRKELAGASVPGDGESALTIHRKIREALLKSVAIGGLPKVCIRFNHSKSTRPIPQFSASRQVIKQARKKGITNYCIQPTTTGN